MSTAMMSVFEAAQGLTVAVELIKGAMAAGDALDRAELKFKLAEALTALADAKSSVADAKTELQRAYDELDELEAKLALMATTARHLDGYYELIDERAKGDPFCTGCWEVEHRLVHLVRGDRVDTFNYCPACKQKYSRRTTPFNVGSTDGGAEGSIGNRTA